MIKTFSILVPTTATRLSNLLDLPNYGSAILLQAPATNVADIFFGDDGNQSGILSSGKSIALPMTKYGMINIVGTTGDSINITIIN